MLPEITRAVRPPRALSVPFELGYPLGTAGDPEGQRALLRRLLALCASPKVPAIEVWT
jgi:hypothetical protein